MNKLDSRGYSLRGRKCCKNPKATVPPMTFTLAVTPNEVIGLSFVVKANVAIYFTDFLREVMYKLREIQRSNPVKFCITIDNARVHKKELIEPLAKASKIPVLCLSPYSPFFHQVEGIFHHTRYKLRNREKVNK